MVVLVVLVVVAVIALAAVASVAIPRARGRRVPVRPRRGRRRDRHEAPDERALLAEGEAIQERVEAQLSARGVASHRLSGPNPPTAAERVGPPVSPDEVARPPSRGPGAALDATPGVGLHDAVSAGERDELIIRRRRAPADEHG